MGLNAQTIVPTFTAGQVLTAAQQNQINTGVPVFATTVTRDAAFGGSGEKTLAEGQVCYLESTKGFQVYDGTAWVNIDTLFTAFTPTWTNLTVGNATQTAQYIQIGKFVYVEGSLTLGSTTSVSTSPRITLPVTIGTTRPAVIPFNTYYGDAGVGIFYGLCQVESAGTILYATNVAGTYPSQANVTATIPFSWTTNDVISYSFIYEAL